MSPLCQLEMTLPGGNPGGVGGDGSADERWGTYKARGAAGFGSAAADDRGGGAAAGARAPSGIPAVEDIPVGRRDGSDLEAAWSSEQPVQARRAARQSISDHSRAVLGFRSNFGGREAARGARDRARPRDTAAVADRARELG